MHVEVNGTRLWFDVDGPSLVPAGDRMRAKPSLVLVHGGPGGFDHSYFKPHFSRLTDAACATPSASSARSSSVTRWVTSSPCCTRRDFSGDDVSADDWARVFAALGPRVPAARELALVVRNQSINQRGMELLRQLDVVDRLAMIGCPTLVSVGELDPVTPVDASHEITDALSPGIGRLEILARAGHFPWLDRPDDYWSLLSGFITATWAARSC